MREIKFTARKLSGFPKVVLLTLFGALVCASFFVMLTDMHDIAELRIFCALFFCACVYITYVEIKRAGRPKPTGITFSSKGLLLKFDKMALPLAADWADVVSLKYIMGKKYEDDHIEIPVGISFEVRDGDSKPRAFALLDSRWVNSSGVKLSEVISEFRKVDSETK